MAALPLSASTCPTPKKGSVALSSADDTDSVVNVLNPAKARVVHLTSVIGFSRWDALAVAPCLRRPVARYDYNCLYCDREIAGAAHRGDMFSEFGEGLAA